MRRWNSPITVLGLACAGLMLAGLPAFAQTSGSSGAFGGSGSSGGAFGGGGGLSSGGSSSGFGSSGSSFSGGSGASGFAGGSGASGFAGGSSSGNSAFGGASGTTPGGQSNTSSIPGRPGASAAIGATSFLGANYGNPLAQGLSTGSQAKFGSPLYNLTTTGQNGTASIRSTTPASGYFGAPIGVRRLPAYATTLKIKDLPPPESSLEVRNDLRIMLARSGQLDAKDAVRVLMDGPAVVLQGEVVDDDERRLVENMVRLTPGVVAVRNELAARNPAP